MKYLSTLLILFFGLSNFVLQGQDENETAPEDIGIYEHLGDTLPEAVFTNIETKEKVKLSELIDKPTVLSFVYYECPSLCTPLLSGIADVIDKSEMQLGKDYQVITISFNPNDNAYTGKKKKKNYVASMKNPTSEKDWIWLIGDEKNIKSVTDAVGFKYIKNKPNDYSHAAAIVAVSPKGKITRYLYGTYFLPFDLKMAMAEAQAGKESPTINKVLKFCFSYDPEGKKYVFNVTRISGIVILLAAITYLTILIVKGRKVKKTES